MVDLTHILLNSLLTWEWPFWNYFFSSSLHHSDFVLPFVLKYLKSTSDFEKQRPAFSQRPKGWDGNVRMKKEVCWKVSLELGPSSTKDQQSESGHVTTNQNLMFLSANWETELGEHPWKGHGAPLGSSPSWDNLFWIIPNTSKRYTLLPWIKNLFPTCSLPSMSWSLLIFNFCQPYAIDPTPFSITVTPCKSDRH